MAIEPIYTRIGQKITGFRATILEGGLAEDIFFLRLAADGKEMTLGFEPHDMHNIKECIDDILIQFPHLMKE